MTEPPKFENATQLITWMIALTFLAVLGIFTKKLGSSASNRGAEPSPEREHVEQQHGVPTDDMSDSLVKILTSMDARFDAQAARLREVETRLDEAVDHVTELHDWLDAGMPDPPGRIPRPYWAPTRAH